MQGMGKEVRKGRGCLSPDWSGGGEDFFRKQGTKQPGKNAGSIQEEEELKNGSQ
jgi:hypothetical protein